MTAGGDNATHREAIAPTLPPNKPICNTQEIINFMPQSFWQNLFNFQGAIAPTAIAATKDFTYDEKKMRELRGREAYRQAWGDSEAWDVGAIALVGMRVRSLSPKRSISPPINFSTAIAFGDGCRCDRATCL